VLTDKPIKKLFWGHSAVNQPLMRSPSGYDVGYAIAVLCFVVRIFELSSCCDNHSGGWRNLITGDVSLNDESILTR